MHTQVLNQLFSLCFWLDSPRRMLNKFIFCPLVSDFHFPNLRAEFYWNNNFFSIFTDINCSRISCESDCNKNSTIANFDHHEAAADSLALDSSFQRSMKICCDVKCQKRDQCEMDGKVYSHNDEWFTQEDPCISFVCDYGNIARLSSLCRPPTCPEEFHFIPNGKCCPECDSSWAEFCPEAEECDIACQFGFLRDEQRDCDLCRCSKKILTTESSSLPSFVIDATSPHDLLPSQDVDDDDDSEVQINREVFDVETNPIYLIIFIVSAVVLVACILGIFWYCLHRRVYKPIPNVNSSSSSTA